MIEKATTEDLYDILKIYNQAVKKGFQTADTKALEYQDFKREFVKRDLNKFPFFVFKDENNTIGWISISPYRYSRPALNKVAEVSFYVDQSHLSKGIGTMLLNYALKECRKLNYDTVVAILVGKNSKSISLLRKFEFEEWGRIPNAYQFKNITSDHLYFGKKI